tara:strand:+ start:948 stop:1169 length:222 start_codon:yes stop_codon:yes gene_type:complete
MKFVPVNDNRNLSRDKSNNAIINTDKNEFEAYIKNREKTQFDKERVDSLEKKVDDLKDDLDDIKKMLKAVING